MWEETGVKCKFQSVVAFRELLNYQWDQQDLYFVCLLEGIDEAIDIQMPNEIAKADWIPIKDLGHLNFTKMASNMCRYLTNLDLIKTGQVKLDNMPLGDLFHDSTFGFEEYEMGGRKNRMYSSEYMSRLSHHIKE